MSSQREQPSFYGIDEQFAVAWSLKQLLDRITKTGVMGNLRDQANDYFKELSEADGELGHDVCINGKKVGRCTFSVKAGEPARTKQTIGIHDPEKLLADDNPDFAEWLKQKVNNQLFDYAVQYAEETGDLLDGMTLIKDEIPQTPDTIAANFTPSSISAEKVADALGTDVAGLLWHAGELLAGPQLLSDGTRLALPE